MSKYLGAIHTELYDLLMVDDNFTVGEKFTQIEKTTKKRFFELTDKELFEAIQKLKKEDYYSDEKLNDLEFTNWTEK